MFNSTIFINTIHKEIRNKGVIFLFIFSILSLYIGNLLAVSVKQYVDESNLTALISNSTQLIIINVVSLITLIVSIIVGINSVRSDISLRILPQILGFSISRGNYLLSRVLGAWFISIIFFTLTMISGLIILKFSGSIVVDIFALVSSYLMYALMFLSINLFAIFISIYLNKIGSFILMFVFYFTSKISFFNYKDIGFDKMDFSILKLVSMIFHYLMPRIGELNFYADNFLNGKTFASSDLMFSLLHFSITCSVWFFILRFLFSRKEI